MADANKDEVINNNTPLTPRKRGAEIASQVNYSLALDMWRDVCREAGLAFIVDNCTANGARKVAARYLDTGQLTAEAVKKAMSNLAHRITHSERCSHYTLNALGNNISRYLEAKAGVPKSPQKRQIRWEYKCPVCGATACKLGWEGDCKPAPIRCTGSNRDCIGRMVAELDR